MQNDYDEFLKRKQKVLVESGFHIEQSELNPNLFDFQKFVVQKALLAGKYAIYGNCGLGKTIMQLDWAHQVAIHEQAPVLILAPLAVAPQTIREAEKFGIDVYEYDHDATPCVNEPDIFIINYEQLDNIDVSVFCGIVLDEASILKSESGATRNLIIDKFQKTKYKLSCTATPSPNDPMELGNQSEFLDVMTRNEMLAMYFIHDGGETSKWRLKGHAFSVFYQFVATWATMFSHPKDIGFDTIGYDLPKLNIIEKSVVAPKKDDGLLIQSGVISATDFNGELRRTYSERILEAEKILKENTTDQFIIWIKHNDEGVLLRKLFPEAIEVKGSDTPQYKKEKLLGFANGDFRILITKTKIAAQGLNFQNCHNQIFLSLDFSFESVFQAMRRSYRFGQKNDVNIFLITADSMGNVKNSIDRKQKEFEKMQKEMSEAVSKNMRNEIMELKILDTETESNESYTIERGDSVEKIKLIPSESVGFVVCSPPFSSMYTYSKHIQDMGNSSSNEEFMAHFGFLIEEIFRVLQSGRNVAIHCMDLPIQKGKEGFIGLRDFSGMIIEAFTKIGFIYHSRITIRKDPVIEMQRTKALGLLHKQVKKDSTMSRVGLPDYVLIFRKDGERKNPVKNIGISVDMWQKIADPVWQFNDLKDEFEMILPLLSESAYSELPESIRSKYAAPVWDDINYSDTLQGFSKAKDQNDEKHICPLQLSTIERLILLYSNPGDVVFDPFLGIGSSVFQAVKMKRKGLGFELKESYFDLAKRNLSNLMQQLRQQSLF